MSEKKEPKVEMSFNDVVELKESCEKEILKIIEGFSSRTGVRKNRIALSYSHGDIREGASKYVKLDVLI